MSRCVGHCCRVFSLPMRPEELRASRDPEATKIAGMVIYLGHYLSTELPGAPPQNEGVREHFYTCINRNTVTGDCMAYETRPRMCREFPYGSQCPYPDCADDTRPDVPIRKLMQKAYTKRRWDAAKRLVAVGEMSEGEMLDAMGPPDSVVRYTKEG